MDWADRLCCFSGLPIKINIPIFISGVWGRVAIPKNLYSFSIQ